MDVSYQASRFDETRGCEKIGCRGESLDGVPQRPHEPSHGLAKEPIIFDDRHQYLFRHAASASSLVSAIPGGFQQCCRARSLPCAKERRQGNASASKRWLMLGREFRKLNVKNAGFFVIL
jgi:hypothetical protein